MTPAKRIASEARITKLLRLRRVLEEGPWNEEARRLLWALDRRLSLLEHSLREAEPPR